MTDPRHSSAVDLQEPGSAQAANCPWTPHYCPLVTSDSCAGIDGKPCVIVATLEASERAAQVGAALMRSLGGDLGEADADDSDDSGSDAIADLRRLTTRQREILRELVTGRRVAGIARQLHLSVHTVRNHLSGIFSKTNTHTQDDLVRRYGALRHLI